MSKITPVILAGGQGLRLRPLTSPTRAKPFLKVGSDLSLFQQTLLRAASFEAPIVIGRAQDKDLLLDEMAALNITPLALILEPCSRNTAAAIALAALECEQDHLLILPSDHVIPGRDTSIFTDAIQSADPNSYTVFGITPRHASNRYGYILPCANERVERFVEKPHRKMAVHLIRQNALWHSGMFAAPAAMLIQSFKRHAPDILGAAHYALQSAYREDAIIEPDARHFAKSPSISIDYAILEKESDLHLRRLDIGWSDVGCWSAYTAQSVKNLYEKIYSKPGKRLSG